MILYRPFFSIITPTHDRPKQLAVYLRSLTQLDYPGGLFEVIVIDDGSHRREQLDDVVARFKCKLDVKLIRQNNTGPAGARNTAARHARGHFFAFTDDDCTPAPDWLSTLAKYFEKTPDRIIGGRTMNALRHNPYAAASQLIVDIVYRHYNKIPDRARFFASNNMAMPAKLYMEIGGFHPAFRTSEDRELCNRWLFNGYEMTYAADAIIYHKHALSFWGFCKQHFNYGSGAYRFHKLRSQRGSGTILDEMKFHANWRNWLLYPLAQVNRRQAMTLSFLLMVWQVINAAGFFWQLLRYQFDQNKSN